MAAGFDSTTPSASVEQSIPAMPPLPFTAQFPVPGNESSTNEIANWRLLALKAIHDTNSAARLIQSAQRKQISEEAWPAISVALVSETTTNEQILTNSALSTVESFSEAELNRRLDIIEALQAVTKSNVAQRWLQVACIWLKETLDSAEAKHQLSRLAQL
jgi:hypothetical protein